MPELRFEIASIQRPATPGLPPTAFIRISNGSPPQRIQSIRLRCQALIEPARRRYGAAERTAVAALFGAPEHWASSLRSLPLANVEIVVPAFTGSTVAEVPVASVISFTAQRYIDALREGEIPIIFLFSGTVFCESGAGVEIVPISWDRDARFRIPLVEWKECFPESSQHGQESAERVISEVVERCRMLSRE